MFFPNEIKRVKREHLGRQIEDCVCPECGSTTYGLVNYPVDEEINTYKSKSFHKKDKRFRYNGRKYNVSDFMFDELGSDTY